MTNLEAGAPFGAYRLIRPLGRGGFAEVWEAESVTTGRVVALKVLTELRAASPRDLERFRQEGRLAASLSHARCVYVFDAGEVEGCPFISMELVPGGTLQDRLKSGPLPTAQAVDRVLEVLDGLEAAQQVGIIHRDVKPSNVFLDADGGAKIGDFGISKSLEASGALSVTGAFLGTPYYASPEQLAGDPLDSRSDLYSVGVMLYELLTGVLPFTGDHPSQILAQVLTREPTPFARHAPRVPDRLQRVVMRLLVKPREKRFQSYQALRDALTPFSSRGPLGPGELARRFGAIVIDFGLLWPIAFLAGTSVIFLSTHRALATILGPLPTVVYFALTDRFLGGSLGKQLLGLRVRTAAGSPPGLGRIALRSVVFVLIFSGPMLALQWLAPTFFAYLSSVASLLGIGLVLCTMRRRNGYAGVHELVSGTRVVAVPPGMRPAAVPQQSPVPTEGPAVASYGPYRSTGLVWRRGEEALVLARDDELRRDVWIHTFPNADAVPASARLRERGRGSLPWLQRGHDKAAWWDAYGAPVGIEFVRWVRERGRLGWGEMRLVLSSLAGELESRLAREGGAGALSLEHLWIDRTGRALVLDFPAAVDLADLAPGQAQPVTPHDWPGLVRRVALFGLEGTDPGPGAASRLPRVPIPGYARSLVVRLAGEGAPFASPQEVALLLDGMAERPPRVTRGRRIGSLLVPTVVPAVMMGFLLIGPLLVSKMLSNAPRWYGDLVVGRMTYLKARQRPAALAPGDTGAATARHTADAAALVLAAATGEARRSPQLGAQVLSMIPHAERNVLDSLAASFPAPRPSEVDSARAWLDAHTPMGALRAQHLTPQGLHLTLQRSLRMFTNVLAMLGVPAVLLGLLLRGPLLLHWFGIGVVRSNGVPASRWRCGVRSFLAWSPLLLLLVLPDRVSVGVPLLLSAIALAGVVLSALRPERGPADRLLGTVLVPK